jgi:hypothetical protein
MKISSFLLSDLKRQGCPNGALFALEESLRVEEKRLFEVSHSLGRCEEDLRLVREKVVIDLENFNQREEESQFKLNGVVKELGEVSSLYNQLVGKIEVFERFGKDNNKK